jgi:hypothetical protein
MKSPDMKYEKSPVLDGAVLTVGSVGFGPMTFCSGDRRSNPLSYEPKRA